MGKELLLITLLGACLVNAERFHFLGHEFDRTPLGDAVDKASMKFLKEAYSDSKEKNVISSPLGILTLLSLYSSGTEGESRDEIVRALGITDYKQLSDSYSGLSKKFSEMDPEYLTVANKVYVANKFTLGEQFSKTARSYNSEVEKVNFEDTSAAAAVINKWADEKTQGHIKNPISEDTISPETAAALFNVVFFQGHWHVPFNASETQEKDFYVDKTNKVKKLSMHLVSSLFYHEDDELGAKMIELPYKENGFRMIVVLPNEIDGLPSVLEKVSQNGLLADVFAMSPPNREIELDMPKFEVKSKFDLTKLLPKFGVSKIFVEGAPGIVKETSVKVDKAFQEAIVKVDEEGATAGAFTGVVAVLWSSDAESPPPFKFTVDHPFLYLILHEDIILFAGTYTH